MYFFKGVKIYLLSTIALLFFFFLCWLPKADISLVAYSEPINFEFALSLNTQVEKILFSFDILPAKIVNKEKKSSLPDYIFLSGLKEKNKFLIFKKDDLEKIVDFKLKSKIGQNKRLVNFSLNHWQIKIKEKNLEQGWANLDISVKEEAVFDYDFEEMKEEIIFENLASVKRKFDELPGLRNYNLLLWPKFLPCLFGRQARLPIFKERIKISLSI